MGKECHPCDGMAETFVKDIDTYLKMTSDPEFIQTMIPDQLQFMDMSRIEFTVGYETSVYGASEAVKLDRAESSKE